MNEKIEFPIRINRYLYLKNICSRREADRMIEKKLILVNGKNAKIGQQIKKEDKVELKKEGKQKLSQKRIIVFNKPVGVVSHNPQFGEEEPNDFLPFKENLSPIGRLDKASHGLMIMSDDGRLVDKMLNPKFKHEKEYYVQVNKKMDPNFFKTMANGVDIEGYITKKAKIEKVNNKSFYLTLTEGKKHQIRRMCSALGYDVEDLQRIRFMNIHLGNLEEGS
jgi:23S rRNA pseudouridine2604 synthase